MRRADAKTTAPTAPPPPPPVLLLILLLLLPSVPVVDSGHKEARGAEREVAGGAPAGLGAAKLGEGPARPQGQGHNLAAVFGVDALRRGVDHVQRRVLEQKGGVGRDLGQGR